MLIYSFFHPFSYFFWRNDPSSIVTDVRYSLDRLFPPLSSESRAERVKIEAILTRRCASSVAASGAVRDRTGDGDGAGAGDQELRTELAKHCPWLVTLSRRELLDQVLEIAEEGASRAFSFHAASGAWRSEKRLELLDWFFFNEYFMPESWFSFLPFHFCCEIKFKVVRNFYFILIVSQSWVLGILRHCFF
jgi:hypothetical protein